MSQDFNTSTDYQFDSSNAGALDTPSSIVSDLMGGTVASVADFGTSVFNSFAPESYEVKTEDVLRRVSSNALRVYEENPDTIHTISMIGGAFIPSGLALKGMAGLRAGAKGMSWFSTERRAADLVRLEKLMLEGPAKTNEFKILKREIFGNKLRNDLTDAAAMEAATLIAMNDHPMMEDYFDDPIKNFGISMALGGGIGGVLGHIVERGAVQDTLAKSLSANVIDPVLDVIKSSKNSYMAGTGVAIHQENIKAIDKILAGVNEAEIAGDTTKGLLKEYASNFRQQQQVSMEQKLRDAFKGDFANAEEGTKQFIKDLVLQHPDFATADSLKIVRIGEGSKPVMGGKNVVEGQGFGDVFLEVKDKAGNVIKEKANLRIFLTELNGFVDPEDLKLVGRATALGTTAEDVARARPLTKGATRVPNNSAFFDIRGKIAPAVDKQYLDELGLIHHLKDEELAKVAVDPDDLPRLQAVLHEIKRRQAAGSTIFDQSIIITKKEPVYGQAALKQVLSEGGVAATHLDDMKALGNKNTYAQYNLANSLSGDAADMLNGWISSSGMGRMRKAFNDFLRPGKYSGAALSNDYDVALARQIYNAPEAVAFRKKMAEMSSTGDENGYVYLWRGMNKDPNGSNPVESYALDNTKAGNHGTAKMYKVQVKDIVGTFTDMAKDSDGLRRPEVLVSSPARPAEATIQVKGMTQKLSDASMATTYDEKLSIMDGFNLLLQKKYDLAKELIASGKSVHEAAIRTNIPVETVKAIQGSPSLDALQPYSMPWSSYTNMADLTEYLAPKNHPIAVKSNIKKKPWVEMQASMDKADMQRINDEVVSAMLMKSQSAVGRDIHELLFTDDMKKIVDIARADLGQINEFAVGNKFFMSSDAYSRKLGELGEVFGFIGKKVGGIANKHIESINNRLKDDFAAIAGNTEQSVELGTALAVRAAHPSSLGRVWYENKQFWYMAQETDAAGKVLKIPRALTFNGEQFVVTGKAVDSALNSMQGIGKEILETHQLKSSILGRRAFNDTGFWTPPANPRDKAIAYAHNKATGQTKLLMAKDADELRVVQAKFEEANRGLINNGTMEVFNKDSQEAINFLKGRTDDIMMSSADVEKVHSGSSAQALVRADASLLEDLINGYERVINAQTTSLVDISLSDITANLRSMAKVVDEYTNNQPFGKIAKVLNSKKNAPREIHNMLIGNKDLPDYTHWADLNNAFDTNASLLLNKVKTAWNNTVGREKLFTPRMSYEQFVEQAGLSGQTNPYTVFGDAAEEMWTVANKAVPKNEVKRLINTTNAWAATMALRFGELAQPLVNAMSLPILMTSNLMDHMPASYLGAHKIGKINPAEAMINGIRQMHSKHFKDLDDKWAEAGYFSPMVSEATQALKMQRVYEPGLISKAEKAIESDIVNWASKPADWSETMVRRTAMHTGYYMAKKLYPDLGESGATIFAKNFADRTVGNYHAAQKPVMFQGTMGTAMGLFQTYMLTLGQSLYRNVQLKNYKALGATMLTQSSVFGTQSLPGYGPISQIIGENFSDDHYDLTTGTVRALDDDVAKAVLFGLPSSLGPAFFTRGELEPRINTPLNVTQWPVFNMVGQTGSTIAGIGSALGSDNPIRGSLQALSLQSLSRPLARASELASGNSITKAGTTIQNEDDIYTFWGIASRVLSTRPTQEAMLRETEFARRTYETADREARQKLMTKLRTAIRSQDLSNDQMEQFALEYMDKGGTPAGWRAALNKAVLEVPTGYLEPLRDKLKPDSGLNMMIDMMDGVE